MKKQNETNPYIGVWNETYSTFTCRDKGRCIRYFALVLIRCLLVESIMYMALLRLFVRDEIPVDILRMIFARLVYRKLIPPQA